MKNNIFPTGLKKLICLVWFFLSLARFSTKTIARFVVHVVILFFFVCFSFSLLQSVVRYTSREHNKATIVPCSYTLFINMINRTHARARFVVEKNNNNKKKKIFIIIAIVYTSTSVFRIHTHVYGSRT